MSKKRKKVQLPRPMNKFSGVLQSMGLAILMSQMFEVLFVLVARTVLKCPDAQTMEDIAPIDTKSFKQPISALVRELFGEEQIDPGLASRILDFVDERHTLTHRLFLMMRAGEPDVDVLQDSILLTSRRVYSEAGDLSGALLKLFMKYCQRFPNAAQYFEENRTAFTEIESYITFFSAARARAFALPLGRREILLEKSLNKGRLAADEKIAGKR